jgi:hypothetical protein
LTPATKCILDPAINKEGPAEMRRRDFIVIAVGAWSHAALAQQKAMTVIGYLSGTFPDPLSQLVAGFRRDSTKPPNRRIPRQPRSID